MTIRGILFDKDGTLLDFNATWMPLYRTAAHAVAGNDRELAAKLLQIGGQDEQRATVAPGSILAGGTTDEIAALWAAYLPKPGFEDLAGVLDQIFQRDGAKSAVPVANLARTLRRLKARGLALGVATSDSEAGALATLRPFGVFELFAFVAGYDSGHGPKPEPGMVLAFCRATGLTPGEVLVVGDSRHDLEMARRAGAGLCVGVLSGTSAREHLIELADHVLDGIGHIEDLLLSTPPVETPRQ